MNQTKIKICGLTNVKEAEYLNKHNVDLAGFVLFFPKSKRNITIDTAKEIMNALNETIHPVAVVVSPTIEQTKEIMDARFHYIQIHGELSDAVLDMVTIPVLRAFNVTDMDKYETYHQCDKIAGYVFDALEPGSGKTFDWKLVDNVPRDEKLFILAGGLNQENVASAIKQLKPDAVDCSSGVEYADQPGKDPEKIDAFVEAVRK